jgi:hypothetical protein
MQVFQGVFTTILAKSTFKRLVIKATNFMEAVYQPPVLGMDTPCLHGVSMPLTRTKYTATIKLVALITNLL